MGRRPIINFQCAVKSLSCRLPGLTRRGYPLCGLTRGALGLTLTLVRRGGGGLSALGSGSGYNPRSGNTPAYCICYKAAIQKFSMRGLARAPHPTKRGRGIPAPPPLGFEERQCAGILCICYNSGGGRGGVMCVAWRLMAWVSSALRQT